MCRPRPRPPPCRRASPPRRSRPTSRFQLCLSPFPPCDISWHEVISFKIILEKAENWALTIYFVNNDKVFPSDNKEEGSCSMLTAYSNELIALRNRYSANSRTLWRSQSLKLNLVPHTNFGSVWSPPKARNFWHIQQATNMRILCFHPQLLIK